MCKKLMFLISLVLLLGLVTNASAEDRTWRNTYPWSMLWSSAANWDPVGVPGSGDNVMISPQHVDPVPPAVFPGQGPVIDCDATANQVNGPRYDSDDDQAMWIIGGVVVFNGRWYPGDGGSGKATINIGGTADLTVQRDFRGGDSGSLEINITEDAVCDFKEDDDGQFIGRGEDVEDIVFNVLDDAYCRVKGEFQVAEDEDNEATFSVHIGDNGYFESYDNEAKWGFGDSIGTILIDGHGTYDHAENDCQVGYHNAVVTFEINDDAYFYCDGEFRVANDDSQVTVNVRDNAVVELDDNAKIARDGGAYVEFNIFGGSVSVSDDLVVDAGAAELNVSGGSLEADYIGWPDSGQASSMTVSGGEVSTGDFEIPSAGSCDFEITSGLVTCDEFVVGLSLGTLAAMDGGTVDCEVFDHTDNVYLMDFTLGELLIDGNDQPLYQDIYGEIMAGRITGYGGCNGQGDVHIDQYSIPDRTRVYATFNPYRAWNPSPSCDAVDVPPIVNLSWNAGLNADMHHIWLGTNFECVNDANLLCWEDAQADPDTDYTTGMLTLGTTYFWRIEEVDDDEPRVTEGQAWQFTVQENMLVDGGDMEDFDEGNPIWETWKDGCGDANGEGKNNTGSCLYTVAQSDQAMLYFYDNTGQDYFYTTRDCNYSEAINTFDAPQDWSLYGIEAIELMFKGDPNNDATVLEAMYMVLTDASSGEGVVVYGAKEPEALEDMQVAEWQQWDIDLAEFGIDLTAVTSIAIGFGDRTNCHREPGGIGAMLIDDIALYPERCVPKYTPDIHDLNDDCVTDMKDVDEMHEEPYLRDER